jgi:hypothetical protein
MEEQDQLTLLRERFHKCLEGQLKLEPEKQFEGMTPAQLAQYQISHPKDARLADYLSKCPENRQQAIISAAEQFFREQNSEYPN